MGSFIGTAAVGSFQLSNHPHGVANISDYPVVYGTHLADEAAVWRQGQFLMLNANQRVVVSDGANIIGIARHNKTTGFRSIRIDVPIEFTAATGTVTLTGANITGLVIRPSTGQAGTPYVVTDDYTFAAGVITRVDPGATPIPLNTFVYATYTYELTASQLAREGTNFNGHHDDVSIHANRVAVITGKCRLYTMEYDSAQSYALVGAASNLYVNNSGLLTNVSTTNPAVGKVIQLPFPNMPHLVADLDVSPILFA